MVFWRVSRSRVVLMGAVLWVLGTAPLVAGVDAASGAGGGGLTRESVTNSGAQAAGDSRFSSISADGRLVAFTSEAANLVAGDTNRTSDVFVRDRVDGTTTRVSLSSNETQGNRSSGEVPSISADGRFVAFASRATNLVPRDTNRTVDVFVRDLKLGTTRRVSVSSHGRQANHGGVNPFITASGGSVAFGSDASNLTPHDTNGSIDVFVRNLATRTTRRVSVSSREVQGRCGSFLGGVSLHGRYVVFGSCAANLVLHDTNRNFDVFVRDRVRGTTRRVSVSSTEAQGRGFSGETSTISITGRYVAFSSLAANLVRGDTDRDSDVFLRDRTRGTTERVSVAGGGTQANGGSVEPAVSTDGRFVAFTSAATNLAPGSKQAFSIYVRDRLKNITLPVATNASGARGNADGEAPVMTPSGRFISFSSNSSDLVPNDTNGHEDVFVRDLG